MSTKAKTFFDCFYQSEYAGEYSEVLKSLHASDKIDWKELEKYFAKFGSASLCQRVGYLFSLLEETEYKLPDAFLEYLQGRIKNKTKLDYKQKGGTYDKKWMVIDNIGKKKLLSWWYHG